MKSVGYARVSTNIQILDSQIDALVEAGVDERDIYMEKASGTNINRVELNRMIDGAGKNDKDKGLQVGDVVYLCDLSRLSRKTKHIFELVEKIHQKGANIKSLSETWLDTTTPGGQLLFTIFAGFVQFQRDQISYKTKAGLEAARVRGRKGGRKRIDSGIVTKALNLYDRGVVVSEIEAMLDISRQTIYRYINKRKSETETMKK
jgi:DNA invertase Pin-like site-specific DNA recombinase